MAPAPRRSDHRGGAQGVTSNSRIRENAGMSEQRPSVLGLVLHSGGMLATWLAIYYFVPVSTDPRGVRWQGLTVFAIGVVGLVILVALRIRRHLTVGAQRTERMGTLVAVIYPVVVFFALTYFAMETHSPGTFSKMETRTDALYFTIVTLGTVGFGDIAPVSQAARAVTSVQVVFDLVVVGALLAVVTSRFRPPSTSPEPADPAREE
jgi:voltage-gated potassium channel